MRSVIGSLVLVAALVATGPLSAGAQPDDGCAGSTRQGDWTAVALPTLDAGDRGRIRTLAAHPRDPRVLFAAGTTTVYRSLDAGCSWETVLTGPAPGTLVVTDVAVAPDGAGTVLVRGGEVTVGIPDAIYRSTDGGATFEMVGRLASSGTSRGLVFAGAQATDVVYALSLGLTGQGFGIDASTDGGRTWEKRATLPDALTARGARPQAAQEVRIAVDPTRSDRVWLKDSQSPALLFSSTDGARTFDEVPVDLTTGGRVSYGDDAVTTVVLPGGATRVVVSEELQEGAADHSLRHVSDDGGKTFTLELVPTAPYSIREVVTGQHPDDELLTARHFYPGSTPGTVVLRRDHQRGWVDVSLPDLGHVEQLAGSRDPATQRTVAWGLGDGQLWRYDGPLDRPAAAAVCERAPVAGDYVDRDQAGAVHVRNVDCVIAEGISVGVAESDERRYQPRQPVTRGQMATFVVNTLRAAGADGKLPEAGDDRRFADTKDSVHGASIERLAEAGIVRGRDKGRFDPDGRITRAEMATFMVAAARFAGGPLSATGDHFGDVDARNVHRDSINAGFEAGLFNGTRPPQDGVARSGRFDPARQVTRDQMASFLVRLLGHLRG
jgi:hypothetical protein